MWSCHSHLRQWIVPIMYLPLFWAQCRRRFFVLFDRRFWYSNIIVGKQFSYHPCWLAIISVSQKKRPFSEQLQNTPQLIYMSLNKNSVYCVMPRSSKPPDTCKWGGPKLRGILKFSPFFYSNHYCTPKCKSKETWSCDDSKTQTTRQTFTTFIFSESGHAYRKHGCLRHSRATPQSLSIRLNIRMNFLIKKILLYSFKILFHVDNQTTPFKCYFGIFRTA